MPDKVEMRDALIAAEELWKKHGQELVVTSGMDGTHSAYSWHYYGYAVDFRSSYFMPPEAEQVAKQLQAALGTKYWVKFEKDHIHCQWQFEKGA